MGQPARVAAYALLLLIPVTVRAAEIELCGTSDPEAVTVSSSFHRYRPGTAGQLRFRDLEFFWDNDYTDGLSSNAQATLNAFGSTLSDSTGRNPFGIGVSDFNIIYEYFRRTSNPYTTTSSDTTSVVLGRDADTYNPSDRSHLDAYIYNPSRAGFPTGSYRSSFANNDEDVSTGHANAAEAVQHENSVHIRGPVNGSRVDLTGTGWTRPNYFRNMVAMHEMQHALPDQVDLLFSEMFSAGAEAIAGDSDTLSSTITSEVPYTWTLLGHWSSAFGSGVTPTCTVVRARGDNYQARTSFAAYLTYNFRGTNTAATLSALSDDLFHIWATADQTEHNLRGLRDLLTDAACKTCSTSAYFHPGGSSLDVASRLGLLIHNWRVANYVNNPSLAEGQYGYPTAFGFSPAKQQHAWQDFDNCGTDDIVAIPPEVILTRAQSKRETTLVGTRSFRGNTHPLTLQPLGSEYWVIRADTSAWRSGQELVIRVTPEGHFRWTELYPFISSCVTYPNLADGRLVASAVGYGPPDADVPAGKLWDNPGWATTALDPKWVDVDSAAAALEFVLPSFGSTSKAAVVVLSLADGPMQKVIQQQNGVSYLEALPYRVSLMLRETSTAANPSAEIAGSSTSDDMGSWSPASDTLLFSRASGGSAKLYWKRVGSGSPTQVLSGSPSGEDQTWPDWSPRGDYVSFTRQEPDSSKKNLWVYNFHTQSDLRKITTLSGNEIYSVFQPNGQGLAYVRKISAGSTTWEVRKVQLDGASDTLLALRTGSANLRSPRWSPDGRWVYFTANDTLYAVGAMGASRGAVVSRASLAPATRTFDLPRGRNPLALEQVTNSPSLRTCHNTLSGCSDCPNPSPALEPVHWVALRDTTRQDSEARFFRTGVTLTNPRWSPDGTRVAYSTDQNAGGDQDLYVGRIAYQYPPYFSNGAILDDRDVTAHSAVSLDVNAGDVDNEPLAFVAAYLPDSATFDASTGVFSWPNPKKAGADSVFFIVFRVLDESGGVAERVTRMRVVPPIEGGGGCPFADVRTESGWQTGNSILGRSLSGELSYDAYRLPVSPRVRDGKVTVRIRENEQEVTTLDQARLLAVDHLPGLTVVGAGNSVVVGNRVPAYGVVTSRGEDITELVNGSSGWQGSTGDTVLVTMTAPQVGLSASAVQDEGGGMLGGDPKEQDLRYEPGAPIAGASSPNESAAATDAFVLGQTGVLIQRADGQGGWTDIGRWYPRAYSDQSYFPGLNRGTVRLVFAGHHRLTFVGRLNVATSGVSLHELSPATAAHSRLGAVDGTIGSVDGQSTTLANGDTVTMAFDVPSLESGLERDYVLVTKGVYTTPARTAKMGPRGEQLPTRFALQQNIPNPFRGTTSIGFDLPRDADVRIEIYDLLGRRVRTLVSGTRPAGRHTIEWNQRDSDGRNVSAGIYLYRMVTDGFREQRKLVVLSH